MKKGDRVYTPYGGGTIVKQEGTEGVLADRYLVNIDYLRSPNLMEYQRLSGGIYFHKTDLKPQA